MRLVERFAFSALVVVAGAAMASRPVHGASHAWAPWELYSNASGTVQFVELHNPTSANERLIGMRFIRSLGTGNISANHGSNLIGDTSNRYLLAATAEFEALPGAPTPDFPTLVDNFFDIDGDTVRFWDYTFEWSDFTFGPGDLPIGRLNSLQRDG